MLGMNTCHIDVILLSYFTLLGHTLIKPFSIICVGLKNQPSVVERITKLRRERFFILYPIIRHIR